MEVGGRKLTQFVRFRPSLIIGRVRRKKRILANHVFEKKCDHRQIAKRRSRLYVARTFEKEKLIGFPKMDLLQTHASHTIFSHLPYSVKKGGVWGVSPQAHPDGFDGTLLLRSALTLSCSIHYITIISVKLLSKTI